MLKYVYIGGADICFWWTIWLLSDHYFPIQNYGAHSYLRGYLLIICANFLYLAIRITGRETFGRYWETHNRSFYPNVIVTSRKAYVKKSVTFYLLKSTFPLCVYILVVGFVQVWRGLFATFGSLIDVLQKRYSVNPILSCVIAEVFVALTLAFTQKNNAVNLCPTHNMYKYDELYFMDHLFFINLFGNFRKKKREDKGDIIIITHYCETIKNKHSMEVPPTPNLTAPNFSDGEFDVVEFATARLINILQRNRLKGHIKGSAENLNSLRQDREEFDAVKAWRTVIKLALENEDKNGDQNKNCEDRKSSCSRKISIQTKELNKSGSWDIIEEKLWNENKSVRKISTSLSTPMGIPQRKISTMSSSLPQGGIFINVQAFEEEEEAAEKNQRVSLKVIEHTKRRENNHVKPNEKTCLEKEEKNAKKELVTMREKYLIKFLGYLYAIHHRQVFLHIFGGMFWSTTWKLFDFATQSFFINTASDIPALVLIAIMCHSLNHLVLFRFKEMATGIHWKTFWESFCGLFTVWLWAPTWYIWDIILNNIGRLLCIVL